MNGFLKKLRICLIGGPYLLWCFFTWIIRYSNHPEKKPLEYRYKKVRKLVSFIIKHCKVEPKIENRPDFSTMEPTLFVVNHVNTLDALMFVTISQKPIVFIAKVEAMKLPFVGRILKCMDALFLDRDDPRQAIRLFQEANKYLQEKKAHICIFPEGTRNRHPYEDPIKEFHPGSFKIAQRAKCQIVPVSVFGAFSLLKDNKLHRRYLVQMNFLETIPATIFVDKKTTDVAKICEDAVSEVFLKQRKDDIAYYQNKLYKGKKEKWWLNPLIVEPYEK